MADKFVVFKPATNYEGGNTTPAADNFKNYDLQRFINSLSTKQIGNWAIQAAGGFADIYEVPVGKIFILQSVFMQARLKAAINGDVIIRTSQPGVARLLTGTLSSVYCPNINLTMTYPFGMVFRAGEKIYLDSGSADITLWGGIAGFELPEKQL